jgi:hypothetical protein
MKLEGVEIKNLNAAVKLASLFIFENDLKWTSRNIDDLCRPSQITKCVGLSLIN